MFTFPLLPFDVNLSFLLLSGLFTSVDCEELEDGGVCVYSL